MEIWKDIEGYEDLYQVSNKGRVKSLDYRSAGTEKFLKQAITKGYKVVCLSNRKTSHTEYVHRLVANAFLPNEEKLNCVSHKDGNKINNHVSNLEWCKPGNRSHTPRRTRKVICVDTLEMFDSIKEAAYSINKSPSSIRKVCIGEAKTAGGFRWEYVED